MGLPRNVETSPTLATGLTFSEATPLDKGERTSYAHTDCQLKAQTSENKTWGLNFSHEVTLYSPKDQGSVAPMICTHKVA